LALPTTITIISFAVTSTASSSRYKTSIATSGRASSRKSFQRDIPLAAAWHSSQPSPVTGAHLVDQQLREANAAGLTIDRIYQEGEVLSYARGVIQQYPSAKSTCGPLVRTVKVDALPPGGPVQLHAMAALSTQMVQLSYNGEAQLAYAVPAGSCNNIRYRAPTTDQDEVLIASTAGRPSLLASARNRLRGGNQLAGSYPFEGQPDGSTARSEIRKIVTASGKRTRSLGPAPSYEVVAHVGGVPAFEPLPRAE
jgi:hypothetical protein